MQRANLLLCLCYQHTNKHNLCWWSGLPRGFSVNFLRFLKWKPTGMETRLQFTAPEATSIKSLTLRVCVQEFIYSCLHPGVVAKFCYFHFIWSRVSSHRLTEKDGRWGWRGSAHSDQSERRYLPQRRNGLRWLAETHVNLFPSIHLVCGRMEGCCWRLTGAQAQIAQTKGTKCNIFNERRQFY